MKYFEFSNLVKVLAGEDALENVGYELNYLGSKKPLIISDEMLMKLGVTTQVIKLAKDRVDTSVVFTNVPVDSSFETIEEIRDFYNSNSCDGILAVGGGSVIDTAKGVRVLLSQDAKKLSDLMGNEVIQKKKHIPFVVIPTTSGTGSEMTFVAVLRDTAKDKKYEFISTELLPDVAVLDARMTLNLPAKLTASTAIDALCHSIEAYSSTQKNPISDAFAGASVEMICQNLVPTVVDGKFKDGRVALSLGSLMAGLAFSNSMVGLAHAIAHSLGGIARIAHGEAISLVLTEVMKFNKVACSDEYEKLLLFVAGADVYANTIKENRCDEAIKQIENLLNRLRELKALPVNLREKGVKEYQLEEIAKLSTKDGAIVLNKRPASKEQILEILKKIY